MGYAEEVEIIRHGFTFELCGECGQDLDRHVIAPDPLGHAHAWCATAAGNVLAALGRRAEEIAAETGRAVADVRASLIDYFRTTDRETFETIAAALLVQAREAAAQVER